MKLVFTLFFIAAAFIVIAQPPAGGFNRQGGGQNMNVGHLFGKVVDEKTNKPVEGATVQLTGKKFDTVSRKTVDFNAALLITEKNGDFNIENLPIFGTYVLRITAINFVDFIDTIAFVNRQQRAANPSGNQQDRMQQMMSAVDKDLGNIKLAASEANLGNVTVQSSAKPFFEMGVDRKIFNVDKNIVSTGQTATELMKQIPSLNVDIDGNVTLRNATPTLFVDGRPTTLTLDQIPADVIEKVELITNPSAKYDASGGNAGILNIVLKKNKKTGYNGSVRAGIDSRGKYNVGGDLNLRQNKFNFFISANYFQRKSIANSTVDRNNFYDPPSVIHQVGKTTNEGYFRFIRAGFDYFIDNRNTITLTANMPRGQFNSFDEQTIDSTINNVYQTHNDRTNKSNRDFKNFGPQISFKHNFSKNGHDITADVNYNSSTNSNSGYITTDYFTPGGTTKYPSLIQQTAGSGYNKFLTVQSDYENPLTEKMKLEAGVRAAIRNYENIFDQSYYDYQSDKFEPQPYISSKYRYTDRVYAAYGTYSLKTDNWSYQFGLRVESSNYDGSLIGKDSSFSVKYPISIFPSTFITYKIDDKQDIQANYSRRINRPNFFQIIPFVDNSDPLNLSVGNPGLKPEFTNSLELNYNYAYQKGANFLVSTYYKHTNNLITNYIYRIPNPDTTIYKDDSVYLTTFVNAESSRSFGLELTNKMTLAKIWDLTLNLNIFNSKINGSNLPDNVSNEQWSWFAKINNNFKLPKGFSVQLSGEYQAKTILPPSSGGGGRGGGFFGGPTTSAQGYINPRYSFDVAVKKEWTWKSGRALTLTLSMNDFLRTQLYSTYSESVYFNQTSERRRDPQVLRFNVMYRFGKYDVSLFKRKNTRADQSGGADMMQ